MGREGFLNSPQNFISAEWINLRIWNLGNISQGLHTARLTPAHIPYLAVGINPSDSEVGCAADALMSDTGGDQDRISLLDRDVLANSRATELNDGFSCDTHQPFVGGRMIVWPFVNEPHPLEIPVIFGDGFLELTLNLIGCPRLVKGEYLTVHQEWVFAVGNDSIVGKHHLHRFNNVFHDVLIPRC